jgi:predicted SprT family Zn-dependent metalloprotease
MKQNHPNVLSSLMPDQNLIRQIVFHEVGHAAAIYLYNKQKQLPSVDFQITIKKVDYSQSKPFASRAVTHVSAK